MPRGARSGASSSAQSRSTSATGSRRTNNAPAPPQPPPPADPPSASTTDQQPSWTPSFAEKALCRSLWRSFAVATSASTSRTRWRSNNCWSFPNQEQQPVLREPTYTQLLTVVIHGVPYASGDGEPLAEALTAANNITFINTRFLSAPARRSAHPDGFGSVLVLCEDPATKAAALDRGKLGYNNQPHTVTDYRPSLRLQQCGHCQQFGHVARHCRRAPVCRLCAGKHPTSNHPPCQACKDSPSSACGQHSLKCANCADSHMANDEQCAHRRAWRDALADNDAQA
ncbi:hypothetical protein V8E36_009340 [Tilletia maclaganii]